MSEQSETQRQIQEQRRLVQEENERVAREDAEKREATWLAQQEKDWR